MIATAQVCGITDPGDPTELDALLAAGQVAADRVVAVVGKVDGSGHANDAARQLAAIQIRKYIARHRENVPTTPVSDVPVVLSSGCAGLISPNLTIFSRPPALEHGTDIGPVGPGLTVGGAISEVIEPTDVGRTGQVHMVAEATRRALHDAGPVHDVGCVLVKTPCLRADQVRRFGNRLRVTSVGESMAFANDASALGVALALGEIDATRVTDDAIRRDWDLHSNVAIVSAGPEISRAEVVVLGNGAPAGGGQRVGRGLISDPLDRDGVLAALADARETPARNDTAEVADDVVQVFAKVILPVDDSVRGYPTSFFQEPSPAATAKAIGAALIGSVIGRSNVFVSGGERGSHQGPPGAGPVAVIVRRRA